MRFPTDHYVPILKGKQGEFSALKQLAYTSRSFLTPLIDVPRVPVKNRSNPLEYHLDKQAGRIKDAWGDHSPIFVDLIDLPLHARTSAQRHPVLHLGESLAALSVDSIPVTGTDRDGAYQAAIRELIRKTGSPVAIRLLPDELETPSQIEDDLSELLDVIATVPENAHLLMDLRSLMRRDADSCASMCAQAIGSISEIGRYLSLTVAGSSIPQSLAEIVKARSTGTIRRREVDVWAQLQRAKGLVRRPSFGDYGAVHPDLMDLDPSKITVAADIRYTVANAMLIMRGSSTKHHPQGFGQYHDLAKELVARSEYEGRNFSWGDEEIYRKAHAVPGNGPGNKTTWVTIATNHHLEFVIRELSSARSSPLVPAVQSAL